MKETESKKHVHKYILRYLGENKKSKRVYACFNCTHYIHNKAMVAGKMSKCWQCNSEFEITKDITRKSVVKPRCRKCRGLEIEVETNSKLDRVLDLFLGK